MPRIEIPPVKLLECIVMYTHQFFFLQRSLIDSTCEAWKFSPNLLLKEQINFTQGISKVVTFSLFLLPLPLNLKPRVIHILGLLISSYSIYLYWSIKLPHARHYKLIIKHSWILTRSVGGWLEFVAGILGGSPKLCSSGLAISMTT